jgi:hypothetical protein
MSVDWESLGLGAAKGHNITASIYSFRAKVPGGWFVYTMAGGQGGAFFYPDPDHQWDGNSLP